MIALASAMAGNIRADENPVPLKAGQTEFQDLLGNSPFTRSLNLPNSIQLTGVARIDGKLVATLLDPQTSEAYSVSETPNELGWRLVEVSSGSELEDVTAKVIIGGGEEILVRYSDRQLRPTENVKKTVRKDNIRVPTEVDRRPKPTDEERRKFGEYVKKKMAGMTEEQRRKVGEIMREKYKANPNMSDRQRGETFYRVLNHVAPEQRGGGGR